MTLRSRNAPSPILIFTLMGIKNYLHNILIKHYDIWMRKRYRRPTKAITRTIFQQKPKLERFSNESQNSSHLSNNIAYRKLLIQKHSIKTLQKILYMFYFSSKFLCFSRFRHKIDSIGSFYNLLMLCFIYLLALYSILNLKHPACILWCVCVVYRAGLWPFWIPWANEIMRPATDKVIL